MNNEFVDFKASLHNLVIIDKKTEDFLFYFSILSW